MSDAKISHTLHLVFHSQDKVRHGVLITHSNCNGGAFAEVDHYFEYAEGITIYRHIRTNLLIIHCDKTVKTWVSDDVADPLFDYVTSRKSIQYVYRML